MVPISGVGRPRGPVRHRDRRKFDRSFRSSQCSADADRMLFVDPHLELLLPGPPRCTRVASRCPDQHPWGLVTLRSRELPGSFMLYNDIQSIGHFKGPNKAGNTGSPLPLPERCAATNTRRRGLPTDDRVALVVGEQALF